MDLDPEDHFLFKKLAFEARMSMKDFLTEIVKKTISDEKSKQKNLKNREVKNEKDEKITKKN